MPLSSTAGGAGSAGRAPLVERLPGGSGAQSASGVTSLPCARRANSSSTAFRRSLISWCSPRPWKSPRWRLELIEGLGFVEELDRPRIADQTTLAVDHLEHLVRGDTGDRRGGIGRGHWWTGRSAPWARRGLVGWRTPSRASSRSTRSLSTPRALGACGLGVRDRSLDSIA